MKQIVKMSRLAGMLEKAFRLINEDWFDGKLETPIITIIPTPRAYAHYTTVNVWNTANGGKREINIASGTLDRPLEEVIASLMHEMVHEYNDIVPRIVWSALARKQRIVLSRPATPMTMTTA